MQLAVVTRMDLGQHLPFPLNPSRIPAKRQAFLTVPSKLFKGLSTNCVRMWDENETEVWRCGSIGRACASKAQGLQSDLQSPCGKQSVNSATYLQAQCQRGETQGPWGLPAAQSNLHGDLQVSERLYFQKMEVNAQGPMLKVVHCPHTDIRTGAHTAQMPFLVKLIQAG